jgi:hypothetical protein
MTMKHHILAALREEFDLWEELLAGIDEERRTVPLLPSHWTVKDVVAHLWAWQLRTNARLDAALQGTEPDFPQWPTETDPDSEVSPDRVNAWIYETNCQRPWSSVHQAWREGFLRVLASAAAISERDLLDAERYPWMQHYPLAQVLLGTYEHHHLDHLQPLLTWLQDHGTTEEAQSH